MESCGNVTVGCGDFYIIVWNYRIGVPVGRNLLYFSHAFFCNKIYHNAHDIIGRDPDKGKKNVESGMVVTEDASDVVNGGGIMSDGEAKMVQGTYLYITIRL